MKHIVLSILILTGFAASAIAQPGSGENAERIKAMRVAFITNELQLTSEESQQFWPLYNEYEDKQKAIRQKHLSSKQLLQMNDQEIEKQLDKNLEMEQELLDLKREYIGKLKAVLPVRKIAMIPRADDQFKAELLKTIRERQDNRRKN